VDAYASNAIVAAGDPIPTCYLCARVEPAVSAGKIDADAFVLCITRGFALLHGAPAHAVVIPRSAISCASVLAKLHVV